MKTKNKLSMRLFIISMILLTSIMKSQDLETIIARQIDSIRIEHNIPSIAYGVTRNDSIIVLNAIGNRDIHSKESVHVENYYHIGSNTKAFTGFLASKIVEDKLIKWDTKFFDLYPELKNESDSTYYNITLEELLSHRARIIGFKEPAEIIMILNKYRKNIDDSLALPKKRYYLIKEVLASKPLPPYDECENSYSNAGIIAASLMLERVTGETWECLITKLSKDLNLGIHIGSPIDLGINQPIGHLNPKHINLAFDKDLIPIKVPIQIPIQGELKDLNVFFEFLLLCTPAGNISITINNFIKFLQLNINGINGNNNYLKFETYKQIFYTYPFYSMGWYNEPEAILKYSHRGSNMMFNSFAGISPEEKLGIVVMINSYNEEGVTKTLRLLLNNYAKK